MITADYHCMWSSIYNFILPALLNRVVAVVVNLSKVLVSNSTFKAQKRIRVMKYPCTMTKKDPYTEWAYLN